MHTIFNKTRNYAVQLQPNRNMKWKKQRTNTERTKWNHAKKRNGNKRKMDKMSSFERICYRRWIVRWIAENQTSSLPTIPIPAQKYVQYIFLCSIGPTLTCIKATKADEPKECQNNLYLGGMVAQISKLANEMISSRFSFVGVSFLLSPFFFLFVLSALAIIHTGTPYFR